MRENLQQLCHFLNLAPNISLETGGKLINNNVLKVMNIVAFQFIT